MALADALRHDSAMPVALILLRLSHATFHAVYAAIDMMLPRLFTLDAIIAFAAAALAACFAAYACRYAMPDTPCR